MITKRSRMPMRQENPRTFALNTSKGMDESKSPVDASTAYRITNLTVNPDGSLSPRKPIVSAWRLNKTSNDVLKDATRIEYLHDKRFRIAFVAGGFFILDENNQKQAVRIYVTDTQYVYSAYDGTGYAVPSNGIDFSNAEITTLSTTTVISNVLVSFYEMLYGDSNYGNYEKIVPEELYDDNKAYFPRYLQLYYSEGLGVWRLDIKAPEVNRLNIAEGEIVLNPNMTLDNPFAIRDEYDSAVPVVKGILAYAPSTLVDGVPEYTLLSKSNVRKNIAQCKLYGDVSKEFNVNPSLNPEKVAVWATLVLSTAEANDDDSVDVGWRVILSVRNPENSTYDVQGTIYVRVEHLGLNVSSETSVHTIEGEYNGYVVLGSGKTATISGKSNVPNVPTGFDLIDFSIDVTLETSLYEAPEAYAISTVAELTESVKMERYRIVSTFKKHSVSYAVLKAFCSIPKRGSNTVYATWLQSSDGVNWEQCPGMSTLSGILVREPSYTYNTVSNVTSDKDTDVSTADYTTFTYIPFEGTDHFDEIVGDLDGSKVSKTFGRADVLRILDSEFLEPMQYMFKVVTVDLVVPGDAEYADYLKERQYRVTAEYGRAFYNPMFGDKTEFLHTEFGNSSLGQKLYHRKAMYSYGHEKFKNNIFVSAIDSFETPLYNIIDLDAVSASKVTCLIPWRDYLISSTENAVYLHAKQDLGYTTKTLTTSIGVSEHDAECCKAILNGIVLKSGSKLYYLYPNLYSGEDSSLNVTDISLPVEEVLLEHSSDDCFAFVTNSEYVLVFRKDLTSTVLRYDFTTRIWLTGSYPVAFDKVKTLSVDDIRIFGTWDRGDDKLIYGEFKFDTSYEDGFISETSAAYGDVLLTLTDTAGNIAVSKRHEDIAFELDTGQKTDDIAYQHQFVESRLVFATGDEFEYFPLEAVVSVDGDPRETRIDVNSDAAFWKDDFNTKGVASTSIRMTSTNDDRSVKGILRQLILRYNVKGRSIRHVIRGKATRPFKLYETYVKYKPTNK